jgi:hypothetical protein
MWWVTVAPGRSIQGAFPDSSFWTGAPSIATLFPILSVPFTTTGQNAEPVTFAAGSRALVPVDDLGQLISQGYAVAGTARQSAYSAMLQLPLPDGSSLLCGGLPFGESAF